MNVTDAIKAVVQKEISKLREMITEFHPEENKGIKECKKRFETKTQMPLLPPGYKKLETYNWPKEWFNVYVDAVCVGVVEVDVIPNQDIKKMVYVEAACVGLINAREVDLERISIRKIQAFNGKRKGFKL